MSINKPKADLTSPRFRRFRIRYLFVGFIVGFLLGTITQPYLRKTAIHTYAQVAFVDRTTDDPNTQEILSEYHLAIFNQRRYMAKLENESTELRLIILEMERRQLDPLASNLSRLKRKAHHLELRIEQTRKSVHALEIEREHLAEIRDNTEAQAMSLKRNTRVNARRILLRHGLSLNQTPVTDS